jgi:hypothetical protein
MSLTINQRKQTSFYKIHIAWNKKIIAIFFSSLQSYSSFAYQALQSSSIGAFTFFPFAFVSYLSTWLMGPHPPPHLYVQGIPSTTLCIVLYAFLFFEFVSFISP